MGYYTDYKLETNKQVDTDKLVEDLESVTGYSWDSSLEHYGIKWYDALDHMKTISTMYPDVLFTLDGEGEESGDIWTAYFKNGKMQYEKAVIQTMPFDESKLK